MSHETTLLPCPFCGGEAHTYKNSLWHVGCEHAHNGCVTMSAFVTEAEAIAAWNARADYHGYEQAAIEAWESIKAWNARAERTCRNVYIVETYDQILEGPYVEPTCYLDKRDAIRRVESQTYTDDDGTKHCACWRELKVVGE